MGNNDLKLPWSAAEALKLNSVLCSVSLQKNKLGPATGKAFAEVLRMNHVITELDLSGNVLGGPGCVELSRAISSNRTIRTYVGHTFSSSLSLSLELPLSPFEFIAKSSQFTQSLAWRKQTGCCWRAGSRKSDCREPDNQHVGYFQKSRALQSWVT